MTGVRLCNAPADVVEIGGGTVLYVEGVRSGAGRAVALRLGTIEQELCAGQIPSPDTLQTSSGFLGFIDVPADTPHGEVELSVIIESAGGRTAVRLKTLTLVGRNVESAPPPPTVMAGDGPLIAVCMATWEPDPQRLAVQVQSLCRQSWPNWVCVISDDASSSQRATTIREIVGDDPRFVVSRSGEHLGFYRNFERAIRMAPVEAARIALCDQDDRWDDDKLEALAATLDASPRASLAYSDNRIRFDDPTGANSAGSDSAFADRRNSYDDIASLLIANTVTGAASLFRRELLEVALPFPPAPGVPYHDHWLALCALAIGEIAYLDRPTYDRIQHQESVTMLARRGRTGPPTQRARWRARLRSLRAGQLKPGWRNYYFNRYLRITHFARVLELRLGGKITAPKRRALRRVIDADRSAAALAWLAARSLRPWIGHDETFGIERNLVAGLLWRRVASRR